MSFVFILPVIHPEGCNVSNYHHVEVALKQTIISLENQTYSNVKIVVVCSQVPAWANECSDDVFFLDVSGSKPFSPNRNDIKVDKGLKYILGILYAAEHFEPTFYMLADADDYVNSQLADYAFKALSSTFGKKEIDGYLIDKGLQVEINILPDNKLNYGNAYLVKKFNTTCGTCRVFKQENLTQKILEVDADVFKESRHWIPNQLDNIIKVPSALSEWLDNLWSENYLEDWHIINVLGRHIGQSEYFNFLLFPYIGAAKACGHGNHDGPRQGAIHEKKIIGKLPTNDFRKKFGIQKKEGLNFDFISDIRMKVAFRLNRD